VMSRVSIVLWSVYSLLWVVGVCNIFDCALFGVLS
jgi:hypothetical protein